jgi:uncharacterized short protein YbdD (DUF466 family)
MKTNGIGTYSPVGTGEYVPMTENIPSETYMTDVQALKIEKSRVFRGGNLFKCCGSMTF